jgi:hypothetical protein
MRRMCDPGYVYQPWSQERRDAASAREKARRRLKADTASATIKRCQEFWRSFDRLPLIPDSYEPRRLIGRRRNAVAQFDEAVGRRHNLRLADDAAAVASFVALSTTGASVPALSRATGLGYDFCCALAQNWWAQGIWRADGQVVGDFDPEKDSDAVVYIAVICNSMVGTGHLYFEFGGAL